jgi:3-hydroxybutyryl-CoA dehydrogenase
MDLAGLGTFRAVAAQVYPALSRATAPQRLLDDKLARGESGARAGQGFYPYPPGEHERLLALRDERLLALRRALAAVEEPPGGA